MTWSDYVIRTCGDDQGRDFEAKTGIDGSTLSRWKRGERGGLRADKVAAFARGYQRPVLEAFIEAGFISADEAGAAPAGKPDLAAVTNEELVDLIRQRLAEAGGEHEQRSAPIASPQPEPAYDPLAGDAAGRSAYRSVTSTAELRERLQDRLRQARDDEERRRVQAMLDDLDHLETETESAGDVPDVG